MKMYQIIPTEKAILSLRNSGYSNYEAVGDPVDNSIDANANIIKIDAEFGKIPIISITDDGIGMDQDKLLEAMTLGSKTKHNESDLGTFGLGLNLSCLSIGKCFNVLTKTKDGEILSATLDVSILDKKRRSKIVFGNQILTISQFFFYGGVV